MRTTTAPAKRTRPRAHRRRFAAAPTAPFRDGRRPLPRPSAPPAPPTAPAEGRDSGGRFVRGNKGGPGNPFGRKVAALRTALLSAVSPEDMLRLGKNLVEQALAGDTAAAKLLLAYTLGRPARGSDPDRVDLDELELVGQYPDAGVVGQVMRAKIDPADAAVFIRAALKVISPAFFARLATELRGKRA
jgi:hypothetical protein